MSKVPTDVIIEGEAWSIRFDETNKRIVKSPNGDEYIEMNAVVMKKVE